MSDAPDLDANGLKDELRTLHRHRHRVLTSAFFARGKASEVTVDFEGKSIAWRAVPVRCELDLRRALSHRDGDENLALLLDYDPGRLAADLLARLAGGRVYRIDPGRQIARAFGMAGVSAEVLASKALAEELRAPGRPAIGVIASGTTLDLATAWRGLIARETGWNPPALNEVILLAHAAEHAPPAGLVERLGPQTPAGRELLAYLERPDTAGALAPWIWKAWLAGQGKAFASLAFLFDPAAGRWSTDAALRATLVAALLGLGAPLRDAVVASSGPDAKPERSLVERWAALAEPLQLRLSDERRRDLVAQASQLLTPDLAPAVIASRYLPVALKARKSQLAAALSDALASEKARTRSPDVLERLRAALEQLERHDLASSGKAREVVERARMAVRLVAYVLSRMAGGDRVEDEVSTYGARGHLFALAQHQVQGGAWVDHARRYARGSGDDELERAIDAVVARVDGIRDRDDESFARAYAGWIEGGSATSTHVVPIAKAIEQIAVPYLKNEAHRKLAIILLDGMSWADAVELLESMERERFTPLRWGDGKPVPVLAALPTLTEVSRSSFFAGKPIKTGDAADTSKDPERFATNAALRKIGVEDAPLLLKADVAAAGGGLAKAGRDLLAGDQRVVALVVNAIDDQLKGAKQLRVPSTLDTIKPMRDVLEAATDGGRALLLVADHGHVRTDRMVSVGYGTGAGKRYRYLGADEAPRADEIALGKEHAFAPPGKARVAMLFRERDAYGTPTATGEHGGASIAEVVAPAVLVGSDRLRVHVHTLEGKDDGALDVAPFGRPEWWDLQLPQRGAAKAAAAPALPTTPGRKKKSEPKMQAVLPGFEPPVAPAPAGAVAPAAEAESPYLVALRTTKAFAGRNPAELKKLREVIAPRIALVLDAGGAMPAEVFAQRASVLSTSIGGVVAEMQEWLNFDGYMVVEHDKQSKRITIDRVILRDYVPELPAS